MSFFEELKRRNVFRVGIAYAVASWLLVQVADLALDVIGAADWVLRAVVLLLALGFVPVVIFAWAFELTPEGIKREKEVNRSASITHQTAKKLDYVTIGLLLAAMAVVAVDRLIPSSTEAVVSKTDVIPSNLDVIPAQAGIQAEPSKSAPPPKSIAVLPFVNMSDDASNEYFSDGISEEILNALAKVKDLKVAGRTSSFAFKGQNQDLREIGAALNVSHILEGSVRKAGNQVRVTAQLIKADDGYHVWSENYDRELDDIFAIQDEISASILQQLKAHLAGEAPATVVRTDSKTYDLYLLASQRIYERNQASLIMASDLLHEAISIDPDYSPAYAQLGIATLLLSDEAYGTIPSQEAGQTALGYLQTALEQDPSNADALAGMGLYQINHKSDYDEAIKWLEKAVSINPNLINGRTWLSTAYGSRGDMERSLAIQEETFAMDPLHPPTYNNLAEAYSVLGMPDKAMEVLDDLERYIPNDAGRFATVGKVQVMMGKWAESNRNLTRAIEGEPLNYVDRLWLSNVLIGLADYERLVAEGVDMFRVTGLNRLGRTEEALMLARQVAGRGEDVLQLFRLLAEQQRYGELVSFIESKWPDLAAFEAEWPCADGYGCDQMGYIAQAYSQLGNEEKFDEALSRFQANIEASMAAGAANWVLILSRAYHALLAGDPQGAIALLDQAVEQGALVDDGLTGSWSVFSSLRGDPAFEAIKLRMLQHLNAERSELGLNPIEA